MASVKSKTRSVASRYFAWCASIATLFGAMQALAVGLGDIKMQSYLNEPLRAEVTILDVQGLAVEDIRIRLATQSDFDEMGIQRDYFLSQIEFSVIFDGRGGAKVVLTTDAPLLEPYIDFLMEMRWPAGRLLREYTVLVDLPPSQPTTPVVSRPARPPAPVAVSEPAPASERQFVRVERPADRQYDANTRPRPESGDRYLVESNDALWNIAAAARPSGYSVEQTMLATVDKNPQAFTGRNINGLKAGYVLDLPTAQDMLRSEAEARSEVRQHNSDWRAGIRYQPGLRVVAESLSEDSPDEPRDEEIEDSIDDVAVSNTRAPQAADTDVDERSARGTPASEDSSGFGNRGLDTVAPTEAEIDLAVIQNQLGQLSEQVQNLRDLVSLKDQQIAALEAQLAAQNNTGAPAQSDTDSGVSWWWFALAGLVVAALGLLIFLRLRGASGNTAVEQQDQTWESMAPVDEESTQAREPSAPNREPSAPNKEPSAVYGEPSAKGEPFTSQAPSAASQASDAANQTPSAANSEAVDQDAQTQRPIERAVESVPTALSEDAAAAEASAARAEHDAGLTDAIAEAEIYLAYGRHQQAIDLLEAAQKRHPAGARGFVKMIEILVDIDRADEAKALLDHVFELGNASQKQQASTLVDAAMQKRAAAVTDLGELADGEDLSDYLDGDVASASTDDFDAVSAPGVLDDYLEMLSADDDDTGLDGGLSLDLDLSDLGDLEAADDALPDHEDDDEDDDEQDEDADRLPPELASVLGTEFVSQVPNLGSTDDEDNELVYASEADPMDTKLDLARAYLDMGDEDGARPVLKEVMSAGNLAQQAEARELLQRID